MRLLTQRQAIWLNVVTLLLAGLGVGLIVLGQASAVAALVLAGYMTLAVATGLLLWVVCHEPP